MQRIWSWKYGFKVLVNRVVWCLKKIKPKHFITNGTICFKYLRKTAKNTNNLYTVGLLWDEGNVKLWPQKLSSITFVFIRKKFKNHPMLETSYKVIVQEYISQEHASKLSKTEAKRTTLNTNYLPHHPVK